MKSNASLIYDCFLVVGDFLSLVFAFIGAYILRVTLSHRIIYTPVHSTTFLKVFLLLLPFWIIIFALLGLYNNSIYEKRFSEIGRLGIGSFLGLLFVIGYSYGFNEPVFPAHLVAVYGVVLAFLFLVFFRNLARYTRSLLFSYGIGITNVLIVGNTNLTNDLVDLLGGYKKSGYRVLGLVGPSKHHPNMKTFDNFDEATEKFGSRIHSIVQTELYPDSFRNNQILSYAQTNHVAYRFIPGNTELYVGNIRVELFRSTIPVIAVHQTALIGWGRILKRLFDLTVSLSAVIILSPFLILISILVALFNPGPVFFKHERISRFGTKFRVYKFRTMKRGLNSDEKDPVLAFKEMGREDLVAKYESAQKINDDPRVNFFGRFLRAYALDELPQLFNVIKGDMSLVGPRAILESELKFYEDKSPLMLSVKTGITGLAQVSGRNSLDRYERAKLDLYYVQNWSFWLDLTILFKTIRVVFKRVGA